MWMCVFVCMVLSYLTVPAGGQSEQVIYQVLMNTPVDTPLYGQIS